MRHRANKSNKPAFRSRGHAVGTRRQHRPSGRGPLSFLGAALLALALLAFMATPALAVETHAFTGVTIGPSGKNAPGIFTDLASVTVDSSGNIYVLDAANNGRLYKFDSNGEPLNFTATATNFIEGTGGFKGNVTVRDQVAVAPSTAGSTAGDIYVANSEVVKIYSPAGSEISQLTFPSNEICGVAVDATGNIYTKALAGSDKSSVRRYTPTTNPPTESGISTAEIAEACNLAVDGKGHIYVAGTNPTPIGEQPGQGLWKLQSLAAETAELFDAHASGASVEPVTDDVYVSHGTEVVQYSESRTLVSKFGEGRLVESPSLSVAGVGGDVYVANRSADFQAVPLTFSGRIEVFGPVAALPFAVAGAAGEVSKTSAVLHGTINADGGPAATCEFEYTTQAAFEAEKFAGGVSAPCAPSGPFTGGSAEAVSASIPGLTPGTAYRFRLLGHNINGSLGSDENGSAPGHVPSFETPPAFNVQTGIVTELTTTSATLNGSINPEGVLVSECFFEYGKTAAFGSVIPCENPGPGEIGAGNAAVAVHAAVGGLVGGSEYRFRLVGGSSESGGIQVRGGEGKFGTQGLPEVLSPASSAVGQTSATVSASINPKSSATTYFVEYITDSSYEVNVKAGHDGFTGATKIPPGGVAIGSGFSAVEVSQALSGLNPGTKYHFRFFAENSIGNDEGAQVFTTHSANPFFPACPANEAFRIELSPALPDCRAYELASSPDKNGNSVSGLYPLMFAAEDGSAVTFYSPAGSVPPAASGGTQNYPTYLARRDVAAGSWSSQRLLPPQEIGEKAEFLGSTPDLRYAVVEAGSVKETGLLVIDTVTGAVTRIVPNTPKGQKLNQFGFDGASADGSRIFFETTAAIKVTPELPAPAVERDNLYLWERSTGDVSLVGVLPTGEGGKAPTNGSFGGAYEWYESSQPSSGGTLNKPGNAPEPLAVAGLHAISPNGGQIFFTASGTGQLYLRRGFGGGSPTTVRISTPNAGVTSTAGEFPAAFLEATPDGSHVFFMSREKLTADAASGENTEDMDLYRWDAAAPVGQALTDVAPDGEVQGLLGVNSAGSAGYFIARGVLAAKAEAGGENLYRFAEKSGGGLRITFIATLAAGGGASPDRRNVSPKVFFTGPLGRTSRLSENGGTLLFTSTKPLTGRDNFNLEGLSCEGGLCAELYLYSAQAGSVTCISCNPTGEAPLGSASLQDQFFNAFLTPTEPPAVSFSRNLSGDGAKVFFQTPDPLVATDENGKASCAASGGQPGNHNLVGPGRCQDVYEWEAVGSGSCQHEEANGGCIYLLSTGKSAQPSYFVGASKDGSSAFLATTSQLVPADLDQADDVYDARVDGGLASQHVKPAVPCSSAEACKGPGTASLPPTSPATQSFQGLGNPKPKTCKKGYVAKKGKCVKKAKNQSKKKKAKHHHHKSARTTGKKQSGGAK